MKATNISSKIVGLGEATILPGETKEIPVGYEANPAIKCYSKNSILIIEGEPSVPEKTKEQIATEKEAAGKKAAGEAEALRQQRLASLEGAPEEQAAALANELGINPAGCKDAADVLKKVKAALKK